MEPNNNQQIATPQMQQPFQQAVPPIQMPQSQNLKKHYGKGTILFIIILLLILVMSGYLLFAINQLKHTQETFIDNSSVALPLPSHKPSPSPTPSPKEEDIEDIDVESPEADLQLLDTEVNDL